MPLADSATTNRHQGRLTIWSVMLRPDATTISTIGVLSLRELLDTSWQVHLRMRYNPDIRLVTLRFPPGTQREQVSAAFDQLTDGERHRLYRLPQHPLRR